MLRTASSQARIHSIELTVLKHAVILDAMFAFSSSTVKKTRGKTITVIQTQGTLTLNTTLFYHELSGTRWNYAQIQEGDSLIYKCSPTSSSLHPLVKYNKASTAGAGAKQSHQIAQNHPTDSTDYITAAIFHHVPPQTQPGGTGSRCLRRSMRNSMDEYTLLNS